MKFYAIHGGSAFSNKKAERKKKFCNNFEREKILKEIFKQKYNGIYSTEEE